MDSPEKRILVIDDNPAIHEDFRKILVPNKPSNDQLQQFEAAVFGDTPDLTPSEGFELDCASQGELGLHLLESALAVKRPYSVAFVDVRMDPGWDGIETTKRLWALYPDLQVVLCSAYSDFGWREIIAALGASDRLLILRKPFDNIEVLQMAGALSKKWLATMQARRQFQHLDHMVVDRTRELDVKSAELDAQTQAKAAMESALRMSEQRFFKAFHKTTMPLGIVNLIEQRWVDVNDALGELVGCGAKQLVNQHVDFAALFGEEVENITRQLFQNGPVQNLECLVNRADGKSRRVLLSREFFVMETQTHIFLNFQDVTEQRKMEEQLRQAQTMEAIGQLAAGVAHDFNNIMTVVQGHASLHLSDKDLPNDLRLSLSQITDAAERASNLVKQLLAFGRKQVLTPRPLNLRRALQDQTGILKRLIGEHVQLFTEIQANLPRVVADPSSVDQIILNLAINARDAMTNGGTLTISAHAIEFNASHVFQKPEAREGNFVCLRVADSGCGIDPAIRNRIFEPFFSTKAVGRGSGLGLATVYGLVKQQEGWIELDSEVGKGTVFSIFLPVASQQEEEVVDNSPTAFETRPTSMGMCALIVEDDAGIRSILRKLLDRFGFEVLEAESGYQAMELWRGREREIGLLITDVVMPGSVSGLDLGRRLSAEKPSLKIIYSSGYSAESLASEQELVEGRNYLPKPYDVRKLAKLLEGIIGLPMSRTGRIPLPVRR